MLKLPRLTYPLLGVDPSVHATGAALWPPGAYGETAPSVTGTIKVPARVTGEDALLAAAFHAGRWCHEHLLALPPGVAVIELPWVFHGKRSSKAAQQGLAFVAGSWGALVTAYRWTVVLVNQSTWQGWWGARGKSAERQRYLAGVGLQAGLSRRGFGADEISATMAATWWRATAIER